jgi:hypothetical protein
MQRSLWISSTDPCVTVRLCNVPYSIYRDLARRAIEHGMYFHLTRGEWPQAQPNAYLRAVRYVNDGAFVVTILFQPDSTCPYLDTTESEVELIYSGGVSYEEVSANVVSYVSELLNWKPEGSDNAS